MTVVDVAARAARAPHEKYDRLIAVAAYNIYGSGNGIVVHKNSPYYDLADLKGMHELRAAG